MSRLSFADRAKFVQAMADEWQKWGELRAVKPLTEQQVKMFVESGTQIVGTLWVLTWKDSAHSIAKARLVVQDVRRRGTLYALTHRPGLEMLSRRPLTTALRRDGSFVVSTRRAHIYSPGNSAR